MSSYVIAGSANKEETAICENIANAIRSLFFNIDFRIIIKHKSEWESYIYEICKIYGFKKQHNPIVFTLEGHLIGSLEQLQELAKEKFGVEQYGNEVTKKINKKLVKKQLKIKKKKEKNKRTMEEKIVDSFKQKLENRLVIPTLGTFLPFIDQSLQFYVKYEEKIQPQINIPFLLEKKVDKLIVQKSDLDFQLIAANDYYPPEPSAEEIQPSILNSPKNEKQQIQQLIQQQQQQQSQNNEPTQKDLDEVEHLDPEENIEQETKQEIEDQFIELEQQVQENPEDKIPSYQIIEEVLINEKQKTELKLLDLTQYVAKKLKHNYFLSFHPNPIFDSQMILFESYDKQNEEKIQIALYNQKDRKNRQNGKKYKKKYEELQELKNQQKSVILDLAEPVHYDHKSRLNRDYIDTFKPFSKTDYKKIAKLLKKVDCFVTFQFLPFGSQSYQDLQHGVINIFLRKMLQNLNKNDCLMKNLQERVNEQDPEVNYLPIEQEIIYNQPKAKNISKKIVQIQCIEYPHLLYFFKKEKKIKKKKLSKQYKNMAKLLIEIYKLDKLKVGFNIIFTNRFIMVIPLIKPYLIIQDTHLFLHPLAYLGYSMYPSQQAGKSISPFRDLVEQSSV